MSFMDDTTRSPYFDTSSMSYMGSIIPGSIPYGL